MKIAVCGNSGVGKDTVAEMIAEVMDLRYDERSSSSYHIRKHVVTDDRMDLWTKGRWICEGNPSRLIELCLEHTDFAVGIRNRDELKDAFNKGFVSVAVWVTRPGFDKAGLDVRIDREDCNFYIDNNDTLEYLKQKIVWVFGSLEINEDDSS